MVEPKRPASGKRRTKISAAQAQGEDKSNRHWRSIFLAELAETSNVTAAAAAAGVSSSRPYKVKRLEPEFARQWYSALLEGYEHLEMALLYRLRFGDPKEAERKFDNATALRLLAMHRETVIRERAMRDNQDVGAVKASIEAKLLGLRERVLARRAANDEREVDQTDG